MIDSLFYRAVFCQNKYIIDFVELNPIKRPAEVTEVSVVNFDFIYHYYLIYKTFFGTYSFFHLTFYL